MEEILMETDAPEVGTSQEALPEEQEALFRRIRRKRRIRGALRFYGGLFGLILCVLILLLCLMNPVKRLLTQYETAQPEYVAEEIFNVLFADPDWALLYDMAGIQATEFEGRSQYVAYMEAKLARQELTYVEVPGQLNGEKRYSVRLAGEEIAAFTMVPVDDGVSTFRRWSFGEAEVFFTRRESVTVTIMPGYTIYINGVPLDESYTTLQVSTPAEKYLPEGLHGYRYEQQSISGLLVRPDVVVLDQYNNAVELTRDPDTGIYSTPITDTVPMTWGENELILETVQTHALFSIRAIPSTQLREFFTPGSQAYDAISACDPLAENWKKYAFDESGTVITDFYRYSEDLFSVWAQVKLDVTGKDGTTQSFTVGGTYFFTPGSTGNPVATELYDEDLQERIFVHLTTDQ